MRVVNVGPVEIRRSQRASEAEGEEERLPQM